MVSKHRAIPQESHETVLEAKGLQAKCQIFRQQTFERGSAVRGLGFGEILFRDSRARLLGRPARQQEAAQAELMPRLQPVQRPVDRAGARQGIQQLIEIGVVDHLWPLSGPLSAGSVDLLFLAHNQSSDFSNEAAGTP